MNTLLIFVIPLGNVQVRSAMHTFHTGEAVRTVYFYVFGDPASNCNPYSRDKNIWKNGRARCPYMFAAMLTTWINSHPRTCIQESCRQRPLRKPFQHYIRHCLEACTLRKKTTAIIRRRKQRQRHSNDDEFISKVGDISMYTFIPSIR